MPVSYLNTLRDVQPEIETKKKGVIYLNETQNFKLTTAGRGASERIGVFGGTGSGKTFLAFVLLSQFDGSVLFFDPQNRADIPLKSQDQIHKWDFFSVTEIFKPTTYVHKGIKKKSSKLMINACDLNERSANVYARNKNDKKLRGTLKQFCQLKKELRLYKNLRYLCKKNKAMDLFTDLKFILHPHDKGMSLDELCRGKKIIDISTLTGQDRVIGVLIESILGHRALSRDVEHAPLMVAIDECQRYCGGGQEIGNAIGGLCTTGRVFNIFVLIAGIVPRKLNTMIKGSLNVFFIFRLLSNDLEELANYNIRLFPQDFEEFPKMYDEAKGEWIIRGWCFYFNIEAGMPDCMPLNFNLYFKKFERKVVDKVNISPLFYKTPPALIRKQSPLRVNLLN